MKEIFIEPGSSLMIFVHLGIFPKKKVFLFLPGRSSLFDPPGSIFKTRNISLLRTAAESDSVLEWSKSLNYFHHLPATTAVEASIHVLPVNFGLAGLQKVRFSSIFNLQLVHFCEINS